MDDGTQASPDRFDGLTNEEKAAAMRAELYATHKVRGSLGTYYEMYPDERPKAALKFYEDGREFEHGHER